MRRKEFGKFAIFTPRAAQTKEVAKETDILNPLKEEQSLDTDSGDAVQYQQRKSERQERRSTLKAK